MDKTQHLSPKVDTIAMTQCIIVAECVEYVFAESTVESHDVTLFKARELQGEGEEMKLLTIALGVANTFSLAPRQLRQPVAR